MYAYANGSFYPLSMREIYETAGSWPSNFVEVDDLVYAEFSVVPPEEKMRGTSSEGLPVWINVPSPSQEILVVQAERKKQELIGQANSYMNSKQWPGKAAIGRLKGDELVQYNLWLDYLDALEIVDTSTASDITWPEPPSV